MLRLALLTRVARGGSTGGWRRPLGLAAAAGAGPFLGVPFGTGGRVGRAAGTAVGRAGERPLGLGAAAGAGPFLGVPFGTGGRVCRAAGAVKARAGEAPRGAVDPTGTARTFR